MTRISALLRRKSRKDAEDEQQIIQLNDLIINKTEVNILLKGKKIELPKKEFEILWLLATKPGKVFKREEIFNKIWGNDVIVGNRTIDVHIRKLKKDSERRRYCKNRFKGIGYKMEF